MNHWGDRDARANYNEINAVNAGIKWILRKKEPLNVCEGERERDAIENVK